MKYIFGDWWRGSPCKRPRTEPPSTHREGWWCRCSAGLPAWRGTANSTSGPYNTGKTFVCMWWVQCCAQQKVKTCFVVQKLLVLNIGYQYICIYINIYILFFLCWYHSICRFYTTFVYPGNMISSFIHSFIHARRAQPWVKRAWHRGWGASERWLPAAAPGNPPPPGRGDGQQHQPVSTLTGHKIHTYKMTKQWQAVPLK